MGAPSLLCGGASLFHVCPKPKLPYAATVAAQARRVPSQPDRPPTSPEMHRDLLEGSAPVAAARPPTQVLHRSWKRLHGVGAGLQNLGNSCYLNAALQCLTYVPPLANYLLSQEHSRSCGQPGSCVMCSMQAHVARVLRHPGHVIKPSAALAMGFHTQRQEDAHEFLMSTLEAMQKAWVRGHGQSDPHIADTSPIHHIFGGHWRSRVKCLHCQAVSDTFDPYLDIPLDICKAQSVSQALEELVKSEELDGEDSYFCDSCERKVPASKALTLHTSPMTLTLVLKRFSHFTGQKIAKDVQYPERLDLRAYMSEPKGSPLLYGLCAVLVHAGSSCYTGHYFCYIKARGGKWHKMDDALVAECDVTSVLSQQAYVLFYLQKGELHTDSDSVMPGAEPGATRAEDVDVRATQAVPRGNCSIKDIGPRPHRQETATREITWDEWKALQEQGRLKPEFDLRKVEPTLPPNAVVICKPKHRGKGEKDHREQETHSSSDPARAIPRQVAPVFGHNPCSGRGGRGSKKKKKGKRALDVPQCSQ